MAEVVCDTSFLMLLASKNIKNISNLETEIGTIEFVIPDMVIKELERISHGKVIKKKTSATGALQLAKNFKIIEITGKSVDKALILHIKLHKGIVATIDSELKKRIKKLGGSILSLTNDRIVLEP